MKLIFEDKITENKEAFIAKVKQVSNALKIHPDWLMGAMWIESGFDHTIVNSIGATGLIQFLPSTYESYGVSENDLTSMSNVEQLTYVYQYLKPIKGKAKRFTDVYSFIFLPASRNLKQKDPLQAGSLTAQAIASANPGFDLDKDGQILKKEQAEALYQIFKDRSGLSNNDVNRLFQKGIYSLEAKLITVLAITGAALLYYKLKKE